MTRLALAVCLLGAVLGCAQGQLFDLGLEPGEVTDSEELLSPPPPPRARRPAPTWSSFQRCSILTALQKKGNATAFLNAVEAAGIR